MTTAIYGVVSAFCGFIQLIIYVTFMIVTVTAVRSRRPDAFTPLAAGAGILLADYVIRWFSTFMMPFAMSHSGASGVDNFYVMQSMVNVVGTLLSAFAWALIIIGVVRVASPPREQNLNRAPGDY